MPLLFVLVPVCIYLETHFQITYQRNRLSRYDRCVWGYHFRGSHILSPFVLTFHLCQNISEENRLFSFISGSLKPLREYWVT